MSLDTLANVKSRLGVATSADDALLTLLMGSADQFIDGYCGRNLAGGTFTEYHPGGSPFVHLRNFPVASVTSVSVDPAYAFGPTTVLDPTAYVVHAERGVVQRLGGPFLASEPRTGLINSTVGRWTDGPRVVQVVYTVATGAVPADVLEAYALLVGGWYRQVKTRSAVGFQNIRHQKAGETAVTYTPEQVAALAVPPEVAGLLAAYRVPNL
jgi:hypothetical protein